MNEADSALRIKRRISGSTGFDVPEGDLMFGSRISWVDLRSTSNGNKAGIMSNSNISRAQARPNFDVKEADLALKSKSGRVNNSFSSGIGAVSDTREKYFNRNWSRPETRVTPRDSTWKLRKLFQTNNSRTHGNLSVDVKEADWVSSSSTKTVQNRSSFALKEADLAMKPNIGRTDNVSSSEVSQAYPPGRSNIRRAQISYSALVNEAYLAVRSKIEAVHSISSHQDHINDANWAFRSNISTVYNRSSDDLKKIDHALRSNFRSVSVLNSSRFIIDAATINRRDEYFKRIWSRSEMRMTLQKTTGILRKAFLITTDISNERTRNSALILEKVGFAVIFQPVIPHPNKMVSNRLTHMELLRKISVDKTEPWGYIFENDIKISNESYRVNPDIIAWESAHTEFMFLGICMSKDVLPRSKFYCGNCGHAYGVTPIGARKLLNFSLNQDSSRDLHPQDTITFAWCVQEKGFPVVGMKYHSPQYDTHFGLFYQDRHRFPSRIGHI